MWPNPSPGFDPVGWAPEGSVYYSYAVVVGGGNNLGYTIDATGDLDGDTVTSDFGYVHPSPSDGVAPAGAAGACVATGVWDPTAAPPAASLFNAVGPCGANDGRSEF